MSRVKILGKGIEVKKFADEAEYFTLKKIPVQLDVKSSFAVPADLAEIGVWLFIGLHTDGFKKFTAGFKLAA